MLDATERKTLAWSAFLAGVLCLIPGEALKGPRWIDGMRQLAMRVFEHRATQIAWGLCLVLAAYHLYRARQERLAEAPAPAPAPAQTA